MDKQTMGIVILAAFVIVIAVFAAVKIKESITGASVAEESNVKQAEPIPGSCTAEQNCGSPTCAVATERTGGCGCGGR